MSRLLRLWHNLVRHDRVERDLDDELRATLALIVDEKIAAGLSPAQAERAARIELGGIESVKQHVRDARSGALADSLLRDVRHAARLLRRNPIFTLTATLSLAIGIGATTAVFTVANGVLLRAAAGVADPGTLVDIVRRNPTEGPGVELMSYPDLADLRQRASTIQEAFGYGLMLAPAGLRLDDTTMAIFAGVVTNNYFRAVGVTAAAGRVFDAGDVEQPGASPVAVLSHEFWLRRLAGNTAIIGRTVRINNVPLTIVGVAAPGFRGLSVAAPDVWLPASMIGVISPEGGGRELTTRQVPWLMLGARLKPGVSRAQASAEIAAIGAAIQRDTPPNPFVPPEGAREIDPKALVWSAETASPIPYGLRILAAGFLGLLMALVGTVLLIACANLAGVLLSRATGRRREIAVRTAIGAGRVRIVRQLLTETVVLFTLGGVAGLALARVLTTLLVNLLPEFPVPVSVSAPLDLRVVAFALAVALVAAVVAGLAPALHASRTDVVTALKDEDQGPVDRSRLRSAFVVAQIAGSIVLVVTAGLLVRAFDDVISVQQGFDPRGVEVASLDLSTGGYTEANGPAVIRRLRERVSAIPGVERASIADRAPGAGGRSFGSIAVPGEAQQTGRPRVFTNWTLVEPGYFETTRIALLAGRDFTDADSRGAERVVIVSKRTAARLWPAADPIGQLVSVLPSNPGDPEIGGLYSRDGSTARSPVPMRVVGVAADLAAGGRGESGPLVVYVPFQQRYLAQVTILARGERVANLAQEIRVAVEEVDRNLPVTVDSLERQGDGPVQTQLRIAATVAGTVGIIGLFLAGIGIYGVTAYSVSQRMRGIGIRLSLGAGRRDVVAMVLRQGLVLVAIGTGIGLALGVGAGRLLSGRQFGIPQADPLVLIGAVALFAIVGVAACYVPVRQAVRIGASAALRRE